jgi:hypothetical protein
MRKLLAIISVSVLFSGCCTMIDGAFCDKPFNSVACGGDVDGYTHTAIAYGDGKLMVKPISTIKANSEWRFYLVPLDNLGGKTPPDNASITIKGQDPADPEIASVLASASGADNKWIDTSGDYDTAARLGKIRYLVECTPATLLPGDEHKFEITIDGIGTLDPRGHVK